MALGPNRGRVIPTCQRFTGYCSDKNLSNYTTWKYAGSGNERTRSFFPRYSTVNFLTTVWCLFALLLKRIKTERDFTYVSGKSANGSFFFGSSTSGFSAFSAFFSFSFLGVSFFLLSFGGLPSFGFLGFNSANLAAYRESENKKLIFYYKYNGSTIAALHC